MSKANTTTTKANTTTTTTNTTTTTTTATPAPIDPGLLARIRGYASDPANVEAQIRVHVEKTVAREIAKERRKAWGLDAPKTNKAGE